MKSILSAGKSWTMQGIQSRYYFLMQDGWIVRDLYSLHRAVAKNVVSSVKGVGKDFVLKSRTLLKKGGQWPMIVGDLLTTGCTLDKLLQMT